MFLNHTDLIFFDTGFAPLIPALTDQILGKLLSATCGGQRLLRIELVKISKFNFVHLKFDTNSVCARIITQVPQHTTGAITALLGLAMVCIGLSVALLVSSHFLSSRKTASRLVCS